MSFTTPNTNRRDEDLPGASRDSGRRQARSTERPRKSRPGGRRRARMRGPIRTLIDNKYVFEPFWAALRDHDSSERWQQAFAGSKRTAMAAIMNNETATVLSIVFDRLYVLRNQLVHGGATWNSQVNRHQLRDAVAILDTLVPQVVHIMLANPDHDFGDIQYPVT